MKKVVLLLSFLLALSNIANAEVSVFSQGKHFGLKNSEETVIAPAKYRKLIRVADTSWIAQKGSKFGLMNNDGEFIIEPHFNSAERLIGHFVKFGNGRNYGLYDKEGKILVPQEFSSIDLLYGRMFLVGKNYKYGLIGFDGRVILEPVVDDIYMPKPNVMKIAYGGKWYEIEQITSHTLELPEDIRTIREDTENFKITEIISNPVPSAGYGVVSAGDYFIKVFSSISPAYEATIDELVLNHGADVATILVKSTWLAKFPFTYAKNYYNAVKAPNNGPLSDIKATLREKIKETELE